MDWFYFLIFGVALVVYYLDKMHKKTEHFTTSEFPPKSLGVDYSSPSPDPVASMGLTNIKFPGIPKSKSGYSRFGPMPPQARCNITALGENCSNYPNNDNTGVYQQICQQSYNTYPNGDLGFRAPLYVLGRSVSRVRQCSDIYDPPSIA